jgi:iron(III) transport system substrate-binding protein
VKKFGKIAALMFCVGGLVFANGQGENTEASPAQKSSGSLQGTVTVYTPSGPEITDPIFDAFKQKYPGVNVQIVKAGSGEIFSRLEAEKGNPAADIMFGGDTVSYDSYSDLFASYESSEDGAMITNDPTHKWHPFTIMCQPIMVNTGMLKPADYPKTAKELSDPKWKKGGIALSNPNQSGTGYTIVSGLVNAYGWDFVKVLLTNCVITSSSDAMFKAVKDGEVPVGFINEDLGVKWEQQGLPVKLIYEPDAVTVQMDALGLVKGCPHPELGKALIDFICSKEAHEIAVEKIQRRSARKDVDPPASLPKLGDLKLFTASEPRDVVSAKFDALTIK